VLKLIQVTSTCFLADSAVYKEQTQESIVLSDSILASQGNRKGAFVCGRRIIELAQTSQDVSQP
jgi:hypothetical protein